MNHLEPNLIALSWFALLWSVCCLSFLQLAGMYPLGGSGQRQRYRVWLVCGSTALWLVLLAGTLVFAWTQLRWTTIVVVGGLLFLFIPDLFQAIPARLRDGRAGLATTGCVISVTLGLLVWIVAMAGPHA
jgi:hypothetical protein